jgi:hypothetical protein
MLRKVLAATLAFAIVAGGVLWSASSDAAPNGISAAGSPFQVAAQTPKRKHKKKHHKKKAVASRAATHVVG